MLTRLERRKKSLSDIFAAFVYVEKYRDLCYAKYYGKGVGGNGRWGKNLKNQELEEKM